MSDLPDTPSEAATPLTAVSTPTAPPWSLVGRVSLGVFLLTLLAPPLLFGNDPYYMELFTKCAAIAVLALGIDLIWGYTGLLSLGQGLYFGLGAYAVGYSLKLREAAAAAGRPPEAAPDMELIEFMATARLPAVPFWIAPLIDVRLALAVAVLLPTAAAFLFGLVAFRLRIKGVYFSIITQALVLALSLWVISNLPITNGTVGMPALPLLEVFGHTFRDSTELYYVVTGILLLCFLGCAWLARSKFGRLLTALRDNETRVLALGYNTALYKTVVFALAGGLAGLGGALYAVTNRSVGPNFFSVAFSIELVVLVAVGGRGTLVGAILGTYLVRFANTLLSEALPLYWEMIFGALFIAVVLFLPEGIIGWLRKQERRLTRLFTRPGRAVTPESPAIERAV